MSSNNTIDEVTNGVQSMSVTETASSSSSSNMNAEIATDREVDHEIDDLKKLLPSNSEVDPEILQKEEENAVKAIKVEVLGRELPDSFLHVKSKAEWKDLGFPADRADDLIKQLDKKGWIKPLAIQTRALPYFLNAKDGSVVDGMLGQAFNGAGKTGAFSLAALCRLNLLYRGTQVLIIAPTNPLAAQISEVVSYLANGIQSMPPVDIKFRDPVTGNLTSVTCRCPRVQHISAGHNTAIDAEIVVGTETVIMNAFNKKHITNRKYINTLIIDEADEMLQKTRGKTVLDICEKVGNAAVILFSASLESLDPVKGNKDIIATAHQTLRLIKRDSLNELVPTNPLPRVAKIIQPPRLDTNILHALISWDVSKSCFDATKEAKEYFANQLRDKCTYLVNLINTMKAGTRFLVFANSNADTKTIGKILKDNGIDCTAIHRSEKRLNKQDFAIWQNEVVQKLMSFRAGRISVLIGTGQLARGLDIPNLEVVVNLSIPLRYDSIQREADVARFQHQSGRVGRAGQTASGFGTCIHFISNQEEKLAFDKVKEVLYINHPVILDKTTDIVTHVKQLAEGLLHKEKERAEKAANETVSADDNFAVTYASSNSSSSSSSSSNVGNHNSDSGGKK